MLRNVLNSALLFLNTLNVGMFYIVSFKYAQCAKIMTHKKMYEKLQNIC